MPDIFALGLYGIIAANQLLKEKKKPSFFSRIDYCLLLSYWLRLVRYRGSVNSLPYPDIAIDLLDCRSRRKMEWFDWRSLELAMDWNPANDIT